MGVLFPNQFPKNYLRLYGAVEQAYEHSCICFWACLRRRWNISNSARRHSAFDETDGGKSSDISFICFISVSAMETEESPPKVLSSPNTALRCRRIYCDKGIEHFYHHLSIVRVKGNCCSGIWVVVFGLSSSGCRLRVIFLGLVEIKFFLWICTESKRLENWMLASIWSSISDSHSLMLFKELTPHCYFQGVELTPKRG